MGFSIDRLHLRGAGESALGKILGPLNKYGEVKWGDPSEFGVATEDYVDGAIAGQVAGYKTLAVATCLFPETIDDGTANWHVMGAAGVVGSPVSGTDVPPVFVIADVAPGVLVRLTYAVGVNNTPPGTDLRIALKPFDLGGGGNFIIAPDTGDYLLTTVASGAMTANSMASGAGTAGDDSDLPDGPYAICIRTAGSMASGCVVAVTVGLQAQYI